MCGFIFGELTGHRYMAHNSDIANSLVQFGYAILTEGETVEYYLLRDIVGKWKCDAVTAPGGGPVSTDQQAIDLSINSGNRRCVSANTHSGSCKSYGAKQEPDKIGGQAALVPKCRSTTRPARRWVKRDDAEC